MEDSNRTPRDLLFLKLCKPVAHKSSALVLFKLSSVRLKVHVLSLDKRRFVLSSRHFCKISRAVAEGSLKSLKTGKYIRISQIKVSDLYNRE